MTGLENSLSESLNHFFKYTHSTPHKKTVLNLLQNSPIELGRLISVAELNAIALEIKKTACEDFRQKLRRLNCVRKKVNEIQNAFQIERRYRDDI